MGGLSIDTRANVAFKKLVGKAHTSNAIPFFSEAFASQVWIGSQEIVGEEINSDPAQADNVQFVEADLQLIAAANGFAYNLRFPAGTTFKGDDVSGDLIRDHTLVVDQKNNLGDFAKSDNTGGYVYDLYDGGTRIPATSTKNWQLDPVAGIVQSEQTLDLGSTGTVRVYVYTGAFLSDVVGDIQGGDVNFTTDDVDEGSTNLYFTSSRVHDSLVAGENIFFDISGDELTIDNVWKENASGIHLENGENVAIGGALESPDADLTIGGDSGEVSMLLKGDGSDFRFETKFDSGPSVPVLQLVGNEGGLSGAIYAIDVDTDSTGPTTAIGNVDLFKQTEFTDDFVGSGSLAIRMFDNADTSGNFALPVHRIDAYTGIGSFPTWLYGQGFDEQIRLGWDGGTAGPGFLQQDVSIAGSLYVRDELRFPNGTIEQAAGDRFEITADEDEDLVLGVSGTGEIIFAGPIDFSATTSGINSDDIDEGSTNLFFTDQRAVDALENASTLTLQDVTTGDLTIGGNVTINGTFSTDELTEGSTNLFFTDGRVFGALQNQLVAGDNISFDVDALAETITINSEINEALLDTIYIRADGDTADGDYDFNDGLFVLNQSANEITSDGDFTTTGTVTVAELIETSTGVLKTDIQELTGQLQKIVGLKPVQYKWKSNPTGQRELGFIAEEVEQVYPEFVKRNSEGVVTGINYSKMVSVLTNGMQEMYHELQNVKQELQQYKKQ